MPAGQSSARFLLRRRCTSCILAGLLLVAAAGWAEINPLTAARTIHPGPSTDPARRVALFVAPELFHEGEFEIVHRHLVRADWRPVVISADTGIANGFDNTVVRPELACGGVTPGDFAGLVLIGGSGAVLFWQDSTLLSLVRAFAEADKPVAAIGLAVPILARAGVLKGRRVAMYPEAGARQQIAGSVGRFVFAPVAVDGRVVTAIDSDRPTAFAGAVVSMLEDGR